MKQPKRPAPPPAPLVFTRADPAELAKFDPRSKACSMNCGPHADDPRTRAERMFLCPECHEPSTTGTTDQETHA